MEQDEINLAEILDALYLQRFLIAKITAAFALVGLVYIILATPIYQSDLMIQIESEGDATPTALSNISTLFGGKSEADAEMQILGSRLVVSKAVDNLHLDIDAHPRHFPLIGSWFARHNTELSKPGLFGLGGYAWGAERIDIGRFKVPTDWYEKTLTLVARGNDQYAVEGEDISPGIQGKVGELLDIKTGDEIIELLVNKLDANPGAKFILIHHSHLQTVQDLQAALNISEKVKQSDILNVTLENSDPQFVADVLNEVGTQYVLQNIDRKSAEAEKTLHFLDRYLPDLKARLNASESRSVAMKAARGMIDESEQAKAILQRMVNAKNKAAELRTQRDELLSRYTPAHPAVQAIDAQLTAVQAEISSINAQIREMPDLEREVLEQERDVKVNTDTYTNLLSTAQQLRLLKAGSIGNVRIIDQAVVPENPVKPKRLLVFALSVLAGLASAVMVVMFRKYLFGGIEHAHDIEERTGLAVLANVPMSKKQEALYARIQAKEIGMFVLERASASDAAIESLRNFHTALHFAMQNAANNLLMIGGATPGVGKSFISVNTAAVLASSGKHVLLIDLDLRKGHLNQYLGLPRDNGVAELLAGKFNFDQVVHRNILPNLDFIATGVLPSAPHLLLSGSNLPRLLEKASAEYEVVLLDTPPILAVADANMLSGKIGTNILVAREGVTTLGDLNETVKRFSQTGDKVAGVVFNAVRPRPGKYGYGYGYGKYRYSSHAYEHYAKSKPGE